MSICVYQTDDLDELSEIQPYLNKLKELETVEIEYFHQSAVVGELAGTAVDILMSKEVQITLSTIAVGQVLWQLIGTLKSLGKKFSISHNTAKRIALFKTNEAIVSRGEKSEVSNYLVYAQCEMRFRCTAGLPNDYEASRNEPWTTAYSSRLRR